MNNDKIGQTILDCLSNALAPKGVIPRLFKSAYQVNEISATYARIPAIWRGSTDYNISVNLSTGNTVDFADGEKHYTLQELFELLKIEAPTNLKLKKFDSSNVMDDMAIKRREAGLLWRNEALPILDAMHSKKREIANAGNIVHRYLSVTRKIPDSVISKFSSHIKVMPSEYGAVMVTPCFVPDEYTKTTAGATLSAVQRLYLNNKSEKAYKGSRAMLGSKNTPSGPAGLVLGGDKDRYSGKSVALVEGFETGLAFHTLTGMPVYILYSSGALSSASLSEANLAYLSSLGAQGIVVAADNDVPDARGRRAGIDAAKALHSRAESLGISCEIWMAPRTKAAPDEKSDWLDTLNEWQKFNDLFKEDPDADMKTIKFNADTVKSVSIKALQVANVSQDTGIQKVIAKPRIQGKFKVAA